MKAVNRSFATFIVALVCTLSATPQTGKASVTDRKLASDGITSGWLLAYPWPDQTEVSQRWRTIPATLVLARHDRIVRRIPGETTFWSWSFWHGGSQVAYQTGPMHGASQCVLVSVATGRILQRWPGDCSDASASAPAWVKAATGSRESE